LSRRFEGSEVFDEAPTLALESVAAEAATRIRTGQRDDYAVPPRSFQVVVVARRAQTRNPDSLSPLVVSSLDGIQVTGSSDAQVVRLRILVDGEASDASFGRFLSSVRVNIQTIMANWRRLDYASEVFRQQTALLNVMMESTSPAEQVECARKITRMRVRLASITANWTHHTELTDDQDQMRTSLDDKFALSERWPYELQRAENLGLLVQSVMDLPELPPVPRRPTDAGSSLVRMGNPITQLASWFRYRRQLVQDTPTRVVMLHPFANRDAIFQELHGTLLVTTMMTATSGIILGLLLQHSLKSPGVNGINGFPIEVVYLFVATFAFFLSTLISANAIAKLARETTVLVDVDLDRAAVVSEYLGKYCFLIAIPLAVIRYYENPRITAIVAALGWMTFVAYHGFGRIARIYRDFGGKGVNKRIGTSAARDTVIYLMFALVALMFIFAQIGNSAFEISFGILLLAVLLSLTALAVVLPLPIDRFTIVVDECDAVGREEGISVPRVEGEDDEDARPPTALSRLFQESLRLGRNVWKRIEPANGPATTSTDRVDDVEGGDSEASTSSAESEDARRSWLRRRSSRASDDDEARDSPISGAPEQLSPMVDNEVGSES